VTAETSPSEFHPELRRIEQDIVDFFAEKSPQYTGRNPIIATILAYFYTRKQLTQKELRTLTKFSAGTISTALRQLVEMNFIKKELIAGTHKHIYTMDKLPFRSPSYFMKTENVLEKQRKELEEIKEALEFKAEEMQHLEDYQNIYAITMQLIEVLAKVPVFMALIEKEMKQHLKEE
jgi:DNA-binding transcriptional regulator GbsR (MarR family)